MKAFATMNSRNTMKRQIINANKNKKEKKLALFLKD